MSARARRRRKCGGRSGFRPYAPPRTAENSASLPPCRQPAVQDRPRRLSEGFVQKFAQNYEILLTRQSITFHNHLKQSENLDFRHPGKSLLPSAHPNPLLHVLVRGHRNHPPPMPASSSIDSRPSARGHPVFPHAILSIFAKPFRISRRHQPVIFRPFRPCPSPLFPRFQKTKTDVPTSPHGQGRAWHRQSPEPRTRL